MTISRIACISLIAWSALLPASADDHGGWVKSDANPVLGGQFGTCFDITLLKEGGTYLMWVSWRPKHSVALVESADGLHWSEPKVVLGPTQSGWEEDINRPRVIKTDGVYRMWYTGQGHGHSSIGYATSTDGRAWTRVSEKPVLTADAPWEKVAVMCPDVLWDEQLKLYRMWYSGGGQYEPDAIGYATSADGITWAKHADNPIMRPDPTIPWERHLVTACQVLPYDGWFVMYYIGFRDIDHAQIGIARSKDGITNWQRNPGNPIVSPDPGHWDHDACYKPYAMIVGTSWMLWYNGRHGSLEQIGVALHDGLDLGFK